MIYPAYKITDAEGNFRTYFWFCFARLKEIDENPRKYSDFLGEEYQMEGRRAFWEFSGDGGGPTCSRDVVKIEAAFHAPNWELAQIEIVAAHPLFKDLNVGCNDEFITCSIDTVDKKIDEIMYPLMMLRDIASNHDVIEMLEEKGLPFIDAAFLGGQLYLCKSFGAKNKGGYLQQTGEDYQLANTFKGIASVVHKPMVFQGYMWGTYDGGYKDKGNYCVMPETLFDIEEGQTIEDLAEDCQANYQEWDTVQLFVDFYNQAKEEINA